MKITMMSTAFGAILALSGGAASAEDAIAGDANAFLETAIEGNIAEVQMGTLAEQRTDGEVQEFAEMLIADHRTALDRATTLAEQANMAIPEQPSAKAQAEYAQMLEYAGNEFEQHFIDMMVKNHQATIDKYQAFIETAASGTPPAEYAQQTLPALEKHLATAKALQGQGGAASRQ